MTRNRTRALLCVTALLSLATLPALGASRGEIRVQDLDTRRYPDVSFRVSFQGFSQATEDGTPEVRVSENGREIDGVRVTALAEERTAANVVLLVDTSGSMQGGPLDDARAAVKRFAAALGPDARVAVVAFSDAPRLVAAYTSDRAVLSRGMEGLTASGETALYDALVMGARLAPKALPGTRSIVLLSDGGDTVSDAGFDAAVSAVRGAGTPVYVVALRSEEYNPKALSTIAEISGGSLVAASGSDKLSGLFEGIAKEIGGAWRVSYRSARPRTKDIDLDVSAALGKARANAALAYPNPELTAPAESGGAAPVFRPVGEDPATLLGISIVAFVSVASLAGAVLLLLVRERSALDQLRFYDQLRDQAPVKAAGGVLDQATSRMVEAVEVVAAKRGVLAAVSSRLEAAGLPLRPAEYVTFHLLAVVGSGLLAQFATGRLPLSLTVVGIATVAPIVALGIAVDRRKSRFEGQLADVLNMISGSLRGGWGVQQAIGLVVQEAPSPAAEEFKRVETETRLGMPLERSLQSMADRMDSAAFHAAVSAIAIQREVGGNLAEVLDVVATTIREREALRRHVKALTAEGRLSAYLLVALPILMVLVLLVINPDYLLTLLTTPFGVTLAATGLVLLVVGSLWLRRATKIEV